MLLTIDIGNTNITLGVFNRDTLKATWRLATDPRRMPDEYGMLLLNLLPFRGMASSDISAVSLCSVVPPLTEVFSELCQTLFGVTPLIVGTGVRTGIKILYDNPRDVGADRIVDAAAAFRIYGGPIIVVDFGTATVFDGISAQAEYLGGAIAPGLRVTAESLFTSTSQLRRVELIPPKNAISKNTTQSIQAGLVLGHADMVDGMVKRFKREIGEDAKVIGTGGLAPLIATQVPIFYDINLDLTLIGLRMIYDMNQDRDFKENIQ
ncbi:type III pantothenate kinase [Dehalococcoidia bacterium]|nr:type III pantothenate kinase [Dehalococcoidia bacterium]